MPLGSLGSLSATLVVISTSQRKVIRATLFPRAQSFRVYLKTGNVPYAELQEIALSTKESNYQVLYRTKGLDLGAIA
jgi:hypothetical protein